MVKDVQIDGVNLQNISSTQHTVNNQTFEIIPYYEPYLNFIIEQQSRTGGRTRGDIFFNTVIEPLGQEINTNPDDLLSTYSLFLTPNNTRKLNDTIKQLDNQHNEIISYLKKAIEDTTNLLTSANEIKIFLLPFNPDINSVDMDGVTGFVTHDGATIVLQIDPAIYTEESIKWTFAHEYHHAVYIETSDYKIRRHHLFDRVIMEGKADAFTKIVYPEYTVPWIEPLNDDERHRVLYFLRMRRNSYNAEDIYSMHNGGAGMPQWSNYKIGFEIMQSFIENNSDISIKEWTVMRAESIIKNSDFKSILE